MKKALYVWISLSAAVISGCSENKSSVCSGTDVDEAFSIAAKADSLMYDIIRQETPNPPFKTDPRWLEMNQALEGVTKTLDDNAQKIEMAKAECISMPDEYGKVESAVSLLTMGEMMAATITRSVLEQTDPSERREIYTRVCNGEFTDFQGSDELNYYTYAQYTMPNRYQYWYNNVKKLDDERVRLNSAVVESSERLEQYEYNFFETAYKTVKMSIRDAALDSANDTKTSFSCSANLYAEIAGWNSSFRILKYDLKITSDGLRRVQVTKDDTYMALSPIDYE